MRRRARSSFEGGDLTTSNTIPAAIGNGVHIVDVSAAVLQQKNFSALYYTLCATVIACGFVYLGNRIRPEAIPIVIAGFLGLRYTVFYALRRSCSRFFYALPPGFNGGERPLVFESARHQAGYGHLWTSRRKLIATAQASSSRCLSACSTCPVGLSWSF